MPQNSTLLTAPEFLRKLLPAEGPPEPTLGYGQPGEHPGFHIMETPTDHQVETLTGLGATGVEWFLACVTGRPLQAHPMLPLIQVSAGEGASAGSDWADDFDLLFGPVAEDPAELTASMMALIGRVAAKQYTPKLFGCGCVDFQMTRGRLGVSL